MDRKTLLVGILLLIALIASVVVSFERSFVWKDVPVENADTAADTP